MLDELFKDPLGWDFFQALRQIECAYRDKARIGTSTTLRDDAVRFGQFISMAFAGSTVAAPHPEAGAASERPKLLVRFNGLTGPNGPLPTVLSELVRNRLIGIDDPDLPPTVFGDRADQPLETRRDPALAEFLDIFHHRLISLFYRAWALAQKTVDFDRHEMAGERNYFSEWIATVFGQGLPELDGLDSIPGWQKLAFAGHLSNPTRHLSGLAGILSVVFGAPTRVEPLVGHWVGIPVKERCRLGRSRGTGTMGKTCVIGSRFWDRQQKFVIVVGPMPYHEFLSFLPGGDCHRLLHEWISYYTRREFYWEAQIVLQREQVPSLQLRSGKRGMQLGRNAWLHHHHRTRRFGRKAWPRDYERITDAGDYRIRGGAIPITD